MRIVCEQCGKVGLLHKIGKQYFRVRHYLGIDPNTHKPKFSYHQQSIKWVNNQLAIVNMTIDQLDKVKKNIDLNKSKSPSNKIIAGGVGFEPTTTSLGGLRPIHARRPAQIIAK